MKFIVDFIKRKFFRIDIKKKSNTEIVIARQPIFKIHEDIKNLIWIADGLNKNYDPRQTDKNYSHKSGINITVSFMWQVEPSLIYTKEKIIVPSDWNTVEKPHYYPSYKSLTPEQKWIYIKLLENPYNVEIDIGFVFILYYGLERHLLEGDFDSAFKVILKLRDVHKNKSFQYYSANALILSSMMKNRGDMASKFIEALDDSQKLAFPDNLFLICYYSFDIPLTAKDIMRMAKSFEFNKLNYIKGHSELFEKILSEKIFESCGNKFVILKNYYTEEELKKIKNQDVQIFANMSIIGEKIKIPLVCEVFKFKNDIQHLLESTHQQVKLNLANLRKKNKQNS